MWKLQIGLVLAAGVLLTDPARADETRAAAGAVPHELRAFFDALRHVESGSFVRPREALGDAGRSLGPYQISRAYWKDSGVGGDWRRCRNIADAEKAMLAYWERYCPEALQQRDLETLARVHNGGPSGHRKAGTAAYWTRVRERLAAAE